jgi:hypothetical protein
MKEKEKERILKPKIDKKTNQCIFFMNLLKKKRESNLIINTS